MTQHTQGRLTYHPEGELAVFLLEPDGTTVAKLSATLNTTAHRSLVANTRRLVACWNACGGIETEVLEQHGLGVIAAEVSRSMTIMKDALHQISLASQNSIEQLERENAELHRDAERYRWLATYFVSDSTEHDDAIVAASEFGIDNLNAAIDKAMKEQT
jgi:hypothetical protein